MQVKRLPGFIAAGLVQMVAALASAEGDATVRATGKPTDTARSERAPTPPSVGLWGQHGLYRTCSSDLKGHAMTLTASGNLEYSIVYDALVGKDQNSRFVGRYGLLFIPFEFLEVSATYNMLLNSNSKPASGSEGTLQLLGDVAFDVRAALDFPLAGGRLGLSLGPQVRFASGSRSNFEPDAFSIGVLAGATYVFREAIPLKVHVNFGVLVDRSRNLLEGFRTSGDSLSTLSDLYARVDGAAVSSYGISAYSPVYLFRVGVELPLKNIVPWVEYSLDLLSASALPPYRSSDLKAGDHPQHLVVGARAFITRDRALTLGGALDFGFNGGRFASYVGVPGQLPWSLVANVAYTFGRASDKKCPDCPGAK
ncbi:MAG: hypothetical protein HYY84_03795 [Deltaproteobacteria bacterium]|nr:hypothetical protein [Deltaproteobacteria bacterium]